MKNFIIAIASLFTLFACSTTTPPPTNEEIAEQAVVDDLLDPNSWELISSKIMDTYTLSEDYTKRALVNITTANTLLDEAKSMVRLSKLAYSTRVSNEYIDKSKEIAEEAKVYAEMSKAFSDSSEAIQGTPQDTILYVRYQVKGYATSRDGQKRIGEWVVKMKNDKVIGKELL